jgi:hypothetical protein
MNDYFSMTAEEEAAIATLRNRGCAVVVCAQSWCELATPFRKYFVHSALSNNARQEVIHNEQLILAYHSTACFCKHLSVGP